MLLFLFYIKQMWEKGMNKRKKKKSVTHFVLSYWMIVLFHCLCVSTNQMCINGQCRLKSWLEDIQNCCQWYFSCCYTQQEKIPLTTILYIYIYTVVVFACDDGQHWSLLTGVCCIKAYMGIMVLCPEQVFWWYWCACCFVTGIWLL